MNQLINAADYKRNDDKKTALFWEGENGVKKALTFEEIRILSNKFANFIKKRDVKKGDRIFFFLPRIPLVYFGFLGVLKLGAIGGNLFAAFGTDALQERLSNSEAKVLITNRELYPRVQAVEKNLPRLKVILAEDIEQQLEAESDWFDTVFMEEDDPAFMMYTSSTGNTPVCGIVIPHKSIYQQLETAKLVLDLKESDIYWSTADPGWITGTVYGILVPWNLGITQIVYEGRFNPEKWFSILQEYKVSVWYTAPTALRMLQQDEDLLKNYNLHSLRHICSVGEALPPATIDWSLKNLGLPVHDTWWQTETGAIMIANLTSLDIKPGSMGKPVPGITGAILDENQQELPDSQEGDLAFKPGWPSMMIDVWGNRKQYQRYFKNGWFVSGDKAVRDNDGYFWFKGRADDIIKTSGERVGPFEVESSLLEHPSVAEAGVIGKPDPIRGEIIKAFVVLKPGTPPSEALKEQLQQHVKTRLAGHAYPREIEFINRLPKNKSGKIVRRYLKAKELGLPLGDTSTLENKF